MIFCLLADAIARGSFAPRLLLLLPPARCAALLRRLLASLALALPQRGGSPATLLSSCL